MTNHVTGFALSKTMRELLGTLTTDWTIYRTHAHPRVTARALAARGLAQVAGTNSGDTYQARLTAGGARERERLTRLAGERKP